jgi:hypothetical protein
MLLFLLGLVLAFGYARDQDAASLTRPQPLTVDPARPRPAKVSPAVALRPDAEP